MFGVEEILCELEREEMNEQGLPPGFRFHPTDEELITFYLASKVFNGSFCGVEIAEVDLNRCEPWELPDVAKMGEREWYFFSLRDRKYPTGLRTNRATGAGYWKATGKDREVYGASSGALLGMKKTLVFYRGRAPKGEKTKWVMHEYRLDGDFSCRHTGKEEWVICRIFHKIGEKIKNTPTMTIHGLNYLTKASTLPTTNANSSSLPPLLEPPTTLLLESQSLNNQNPFIFHTQESHDLKALINPLVSQSCLISPNNLSQHLTSTPSFANSNIDLLKPPFLAHHHQDFSLKELSDAIAKQCKKENHLASLQPHFQLLSDGLGNNMRAEGIQENTKYHNNPIFLFGGGDQMGITSSTVGGVDNGNVAVMDAAAIDHVMSTEPAFRWW